MGWCFLWLTLLTGATSSLDPTITPFESGMPRLVPQLAILLRGTLAQCIPLRTLPMGATSSPDPTIARLEPGVLMLVLQPASLSRGIPNRSSLLLTLRTGGTSFLGLVTTLPVCGTHFHLLPSDLPLVALNFLRSPTWMVGYETQRVAYYTGYPMSVVQACIHLPLWRSPSHLVFDPSLLTLTILPLEPHGPKFWKVHLPSLSFHYTLRM